MEDKLIFVLLNVSFSVNKDYYYYFYYYFSILMIFLTINIV